MNDRHYCPACGAALVSEPIGAPFKCTHCRWHLITLAAWQTLPPFDQGYMLYMQGSWPTSEIANEQNPYANGTPEWMAFRRGQERGALTAQDGEE